jgi:hypothetical protein
MAPGNDPPMRTAQADIAAAFQAWNIFPCATGDKIESGLLPSIYRLSSRETGGA